VDVRAAAAAGAAGKMYHPFLQLDHPCALAWPAERRYETNCHLKFYQPLPLLSAAVIPQLDRICFV
jgi:hypothetical protein